MQIDLEKPVTQSQFAKIIGVSQPLVFKLLDRGTLQPGGTLGEWLLAYCASLREVAAGRGGDDQFAMAEARARQARFDADLRELEFFEKIGALVQVEDIEPLLSGWAATGRAELLHAVDTIIAGIESRYGIEIDRELVDGPAAAACQAIARYPQLAGHTGEPGSDGLGACREGTDDAVAG